MKTINFIRKNIQKIPTFNTFIIGLLLTIIISTPIPSCKDDYTPSTTIEELSTSGSGATAASSDDGKDMHAEVLDKPIIPTNKENTNKNNSNKLLNSNLDIFEDLKDNIDPEKEKLLDQKLTELRKEQNPTYKINRGDTMEISIPFESDTEMIVNVRPDGTLGYMYGVEVHAAGLTYPELKETIEKKLEKYYINPSVDINGKTYSGSQVYVMGPVNNPGGIVIQNNTKLVDFLSMAGVLSKLPSTNLISYSNSRVTNDVIDLAHSYIMRDGKILPIDFERLLLKREMKFNIYMRANDFLFFPSSYLSDISKTVYIIGAVMTPRTYSYTTETTFMAAISAAGGVDKYRADRKHCVIIRKSSGKIINVNYVDITNGKIEDLQLQDRDIVFVPERGLYAASRWTTTVIDEIIAPLRSVIQASSTTKAINNQDWKPVSSFGPTDDWMR